MLVYMGLLKDCPSYFRIILRKNTKEISGTMILSKN